MFEAIWVYALIAMMPPTIVTQWPHVSDLTPVTVQAVFYTKAKCVMKKLEMPAPPEGKYWECQKLPKDWFEANIIR
jgi:hypothetical protein